MIFEFDHTFEREFLCNNKKINILDKDLNSSINISIILEMI